jgi:hypothetical protein
VCFVDDDSPGGKTISEVKASPSAASENQAVAQTIVFSMLQKQKHPDFPHHLVPNIVISPTEFYVIMYDSVNDVLVGCFPMRLFSSTVESLNIDSVIILWMVLHYRMFCKGIEFDKVAGNLKGFDFRSHFREKAGTKWDVYTTSLRENVGYFPPLKAKNLLTMNMMKTTSSLKVG